ncbi:MAG: carbamoyltransferase HypF [Anaerolineaceae bacterium]|nr:MAG: carbamoyltransferase HypF [Anaerolineaceae bacterium]
MRRNVMVDCVRIVVEGTVQGVGFRPFVYRLAHDLAVRGWVNNSPQGVTIEAEAVRDTLDAFIAAIRADAPPHASVQRVTVSPAPAAGYTGFEIRASDESGQRRTLVLPDLATCPDCLAELFDPSDRRYRYPFINCTHCGPRYSIMQALPYDRPHTTMRHFLMCDACRSEYENPLDRRFHAQPIACPECGPHVMLGDAGQGIIAEDDEALRGAVDAIRRGQIVALKGLGGFQLLVDATQHGAVMRLRRRKHRPDKPFALMYPDLQTVRADCDVCPESARLLASPAAPIVLVRRRYTASLSAAIAPDNPYLGVMLPYTPLHHLLMHDLGRPIVATSGNRSDEPICIDAESALQELGDIADVFLLHNRPIARQVDDSVVRVVSDKPLLLRRARGYAPLTIPLHGDDDSRLAFGAHQKSTVAAYDGAQAILSQHIGDLQTVGTMSAFHRTLDDLQRLYDLSPPVRVICDMHPDYYSSHAAEGSGLPLTRVQHHAAHLFACMAEHDLAAPVLGVIWDGTGYGTDGTVWGGEFLHLADDTVQRVAHFQPFYLPGGERAVSQPCRAAFGLLYALYDGDISPDHAFVRALGEDVVPILSRAIERGINAPLTSSVGRLYDAVASLLDMRHDTSFEGQAAMMLEFAAMRAGSCGGDVPPYPFAYPADATQIGLKPLISALLADLAGGLPRDVIALRFHRTLTTIAVDVARRVGAVDVALSGGCFQNSVLLNCTINHLREAGFRPHWNHAVPPNDGGIALGQLLAELRGYRLCV